MSINETDRLSTTDEVRTFDNKSDIVNTSTASNGSIAEQPKERIQIVGEISQFSSAQEKENLRFIVGGILLHLEEETPEGIFNLLFDKYETSIPSEEEPTISTELFREALECAISDCTSDSASETASRLKSLEPFCFSGSFENKENITAQFCFRKQLLKIGCQITTDDELKKIVDKFEEKELGKNKDDVKTPMELFRCLLRKGVISPDDPSSIVSLEQKLGIFKVAGVTTSAKSFQALSSEGHAVDGGCGMHTQKGSYSFKSISCLFVIVFYVFVAVALVGFSLYCVWLSSTQSHTQDVLFYRNNTILVAREPLSSAFTERVNFTLNSNHQSDLQVCYYDCTNISPQTRFVSVNVSRSSSHDQKKPSSSQRRLVMFSNSVEVTFASVFMLGGSSVVFSVTGLNQQIELYILTTFEQCKSFLRGFDNSSFERFELNASNDYRVNFVVPQSPHNNYCGAWVIPPEIMNATFQYMIKGFRNIYNLESSVSSNVTCVSPFTSPSYDLYIPMSYTLRRMCVFLAQMDHNSFTTGTIQTFPTLKNPLFGVPMSIGSFLFFILPIIICFVIKWAYKQCNTS